MTPGEVDFNADSLLDPVLGNLISVLGEWFLGGALEGRLSAFQSYDDFFARAEELVCDFNSYNTPICDHGGEICGCPKATVSNTDITHNWRDLGPAHVNVSAGLALAQMTIPMCMIR